MKVTWGGVIGILLNGLALASAAQDTPWSASGRVLDASDKSPVIGATVLMVNIKDSTRSKFAIVGREGRFQVNNLEKAFYKLKITSMGYKPYTKISRLTVPAADLGTISLEQDLKTLNEVLVEGEVVPVEQVGDTTQYNADAFKTHPDATARDLVSKMPGIVVDNDGVTANGESIEQVLLDGKRFFGQDPLLSLNTIPAEIVDKVQVYDEASDQSQFTGFDDGNTTRTMNVVTKKDKRNGQFGKAYAGYGTHELYKAGTTINSFDQDRRTTILGMSNNINQQNFGNEDLAVVSGGGRRGGFRRGGNSNFMTGTQDGITKTHSVGINFTDDWGEKATFEGSYFFNQSDNSQDQLLSRESFLENGSQFYTEDQQSATDNLNHRLNVRMDYKIDDKNSLLLRSSFSHQDNQSNELTIGRTGNGLGELLSETNNSYSSLNRAFNISNNLVYQRKLKKVGRTLSLNVNAQLRPTRRENFFEDLQLDSLIEYLTDENQYRIGSAITYTEPIGTTAQLAMRYEVNHSVRESDKETFTLQEGDVTRMFSEALSNYFKSGYTTHAPSIRYSDHRFGNHFNVAIAYQWATLRNDQILPVKNQFERHFRNILPSVMGRFDLSKNGRLLIRYTTSATEPSISQLQNVLDNSDPLFLTVGNPGLEQTYTHSLIMRLQKDMTGKNATFSNSTRVETSLDYITTSTTIIASDSVAAGGISLAEGAQVSTPVNLDGYWSVRNNTTYGILISPLKSNLNTSVGLAYQRIPGITNGLTNMANTYSANIRVGFVSNISEKIDYNLYYQVDGSKVFNSIQPGSNSQYYMQTLGVKLNLVTWKGFVFRNETYFQKYKGANSEYDSDFTLWSMGIAKKFLKNESGELELSVFDLLGENQDFDQTVNARYLQETQTGVLQRYFMLTFTYQLRHFSKS